MDAHRREMKMMLKHPRLARECRKRHSFLLIDLFDSIAYYEMSRKLYLIWSFLAAQLL